MKRCPSCGSESAPYVVDCPRCGALLEASYSPWNVPESLLAEARALLAEGRKIEAIKRYREVTSAGSREARDAIDAIVAGEPPGFRGAVDDALRSDLARLLREDSKIEAVKLCRERTGLGLREALQIVETIGRGESPAASPHVLEPGLEQRLLELLRQGRYIEAIRLHREDTKVGLKEAKDAVDALRARHGLELPRRAGCLGFVALGLAAAGVWTWLA